MADPLGVYIHWPYCARICPDCDFNVFRHRGREHEQGDLVTAICADLEQQRRQTGPGDLVSIFFGGGTPSLMNPADVARIIELCRRLWTPVEPLEINLEANPTDAETARFEALAQAGVTRLSLGVQSLDDAELRFLGRNHGAEEAQRAARLARRVFPQLSVDFIYALPGQTRDQWRATLAGAVALEPDHISPYQLTIESGTAFDRAVRRGRLQPTDDILGAELYDLTQEDLNAAGYDAYEVSNHARRPEARSRHNLIYWRGEAYVGVGPGAHGRLHMPQGWTATVTASRPEDYIKALRQTGSGISTVEALSDADRAQERLMMGLRTDEGVAWIDLRALDLSPASQAVQALAELGLAAPDPLRLRVTPEGRRMLDSVIRKLVLD